MREDLELRLADRDRQLREIQALAGIGNWEFDLDTDQIRWSDETFRIFGIDPAAQEPDFADILLSVHPDDAPAFDNAIQRAVTLGEGYRLDMRIRCPNGRQKYIHAQGSPVYGKHNQVERIIGTVLDITERKQAEQELFEQATVDALTGLSNRRTLNGALESAIVAAMHTKEALAVCLCDVDKFKTVNDTYGHAAGDEILVTFAHLLKEGCRSGDLPARLGGDEFCVVFPRSTALQAAVCVERVRIRLQDTGFSADSVSYSVTASFGVGELAPGMTANDLLKAADVALYRAKELGRNCVAAG